MLEEGLLAMKTEGLQERGVIWAISGGLSPTFTPIVIHEGSPGWHDAVLGDVDGGGGVGIVSKVWNADGSNYHVDYWRNDIIRQTATASDRRGAANGIQGNVISSADSTAVSSSSMLRPGPGGSANAPPTGSILCLRKTLLLRPC